MAILGCGCAPSAVRLNMPPSEVARLIQDQKTTFAVQRMPVQMSIVRTTEQEAELAVLYAITGHPGIRLMNDLDNTNRGKAVLPNLLSLDPAETVQRKFLSSIERELPPINFTYYQDPFDNKDMETMRKTFGNRILSVYRTQFWKIYKSYSLTDVYRISYTGRATFYRPSDNSILWEGDCTCDTPDDLNGPSLNAITANNGALLRQYIRELGDACADKLSREFLKPDQ
jgi:hypothetical protein